MNKIALATLFSICWSLCLANAKPHQVQFDKRYLTLKSEYIPLNGKVVKKDKTPEDLIVEVQYKNTVKELILYNNSDNLEFFDIVDIGDTVNCKIHNGESRIAIFEMDGGRVTVHVFFYKDHD